MYLKYFGENSSILINIILLPVDSYWHKWEHGSTYRQSRNENRNFAVGFSKRPVHIKHIYEAKSHVEGGNHCVSYREVYWKYI